MILITKAAGQDKDLDDSKLNEVLESSNMLAVKMPTQLKLLTTYFSFQFVDLPIDFQTFV